MGDVVLLELLSARKLLPPFDAAIEVFCLIEEESLRPLSLTLIQDLRSAGLAVEYALTAIKSDKQFKRAQELKAAYLVKVEHGEGGESRVRIRNLKTRAEKVLPAAETAELLRGV